MIEKMKMVSLNSEEYRNASKFVRSPFFGCVDYFDEDGEWTIRKVFDAKSFAEDEDPNQKIFIIAPETDFDSETFYDLDQHFPLTQVQD